MSNERLVTVISTQGAEVSEFLSKATTWGELQSELTRESISFNGMKAVIGETKNNLESKNASLPTSEFELYLMPMKSKSGADRKEVYAQIKNLIDRDGNKAKDFFNTVENYTRKKTDVLSQLISDYSGGKTAPIDIKEEVPSIPATPKKAAKKECCQDKDENCSCGCQDPAFIAAKKELVLRIDNSVELIKDEIEEDDSETIISTGTLQQVLQVFGEVKDLLFPATEVEETEEQRKAREEKEAEEARIVAEKEQRKRDLLAKGNSMRDEFGDVR